MTLWTPNWGSVKDYLLVVGPFAVWLWRYTRRLETTIGITKQVATTHLPFIYRRLQKHDEELSIHSPLPPNIGLVNGAASRERH